jgi:hypothetical protein
MSNAEIFLLIWCIAATGLAVYFHSRLSLANNAGKMLTALLIDLAEGRAVMRVNGGRISFTNLGATDES